MRERAGDRQDEGEGGGRTAAVRALEALVDAVLRSESLDKAHLEVEVLEVMLEALEGGFEALEDVLELLEVILNLLTKPFLRRSGSF